SANTRARPCHKNSEHYYGHECKIKSRSFLPTLYALKKKLPSSRIVYPLYNAHETLPVY
ncbi:6717_t:CDS:1, partial [Scutellospora calospora]